MKKSFIILLIAAVAMLIATPAMAVQTHGGWSTSTEGCADCHVTHAADAAFLLKTSGGSTETDACYACHNYAAAASPYDVAAGMITQDFDYDRTPRAKWDTAASVRPSYAGGFEKSFDFDNHDESAATGATVYADMVSSRSAHNVENIVVGESGTTAWASTTNIIPGGRVAIPGTGVFKCGSCHDPHGSDSAAGAGGILLNNRLLRHTLPGNGTTATAVYNVDIAVNATSHVSEGYGKNVNAWCGGCHEVFVGADSSGHTKDANNKFKHAMGITVVNAFDGKTAGDGYVTRDGGTTYAKVGASALGYGTPTSNDGNILMCLSCHRAHGTGVANASDMSNNWKRYDGTMGKGAALLRLKNRDVCYNCHGGAQSNKAN